MGDKKGPEMAETISDFSVHALLRSPVKVHGQMGSTSLRPQASSWAPVANPAAVYHCYTGLSWSTLEGEQKHFF